MVDFSTLAVFAAALALVSASPGPATATLVARVLACGLGSVIPFLAAMWIAEAIWLSGAVLGLGLVAQSFRLLVIALKWAGIAYLLLIAWRQWRAPNPRTEPASLIPVRWQMFGAGFAITMGNPFVIVFYVALLPTVLNLQSVSVFGWAALIAVMLTVNGTIDTCWALGAAQARRLFVGGRGALVANRVSAVATAVAAAAMAAQ